MPSGPGGADESSASQPAHQSTSPHHYSPNIGKYTMAFNMIYKTFIKSHGSRLGFSYRGLITFLHVVVLDLLSLKVTHMPPPHPHPLSMMRFVRTVQVEVTSSAYGLSSSRQDGLTFTLTLTVTTPDDPCTLPLRLTTNPA